MTWTNFSFFLLIGYALYYGITIGLDLIRSPASATWKQAPPTLKISGSVQPVVVEGTDFEPERGDPAVTVRSGAGDEQPLRGQDATAPDRQTDGLQMAVRKSGETEPVPQQPESGGVSMSDLFRLYRQKAIEQSARYDFSA